MQSTLFQGQAGQWLDAVKSESRIVALSSIHPTLLFGLEQREGAWFVRHELVFGLFRTVWSCAATLDLARCRLSCNGTGRYFDTVSQTLCWEQGDRGLSIQSELVWSGAKSVLEDLMLRSLLRFPNCDAGAGSERPTRRISMEGQAAA